MTRGIREGPALWIDCCLGLERQHHQGQGKQNSGEDGSPAGSMQPVSSRAATRTRTLIRNDHNASRDIKGFNATVLLGRVGACQVVHSTGGAPMKAITKQQVATSKVGIISTPNQST